MHARRRSTRAALCAAALAAALGGCSGKTQSPDGYTPDYAAFADEVGPSTYVPKVKMLLTGLPATDAEIQRVQANPDALPALIDDWMTHEPTRALFEGRMLDFFRNAFQQRVPNTGLVTGSLNTPGMDVSSVGTIQDTFRYSLEDTFPKTAWQLVQEGRPFNETLTTRRYMLTTALMAALSYTDMHDVNDANDRRDRLARSNQALVLDPLAVGSTGAPLTMEESIASFDPDATGTWTWRVFVPQMSTTCEVALRAGATPDPEDDWAPSGELFRVVWGNATYANPNQACDVDYNTGMNRARALVRASDFTDWRWVTIEQIPIYEEATLPTPHFWDLPTLRSATTLRLKSPHVGFFGTHAWFANWPTNDSNQARVTANQALIVALGKSVLPSTAVAPAPSSATDTAHAANAACAACHMYLDPLRQFFRQSYTFNYHEQRDYTAVSAPARYMLDGRNDSGTGVADLGRILANHPRYAVGWAQKLVFWATSTLADEADPDLQHVAAIFAASQYDFRTLVRAVFSSPLVTLSRGTRSTRAAGAVNVGIARRDQLCAALAVRLGDPNVCETRFGGSWNTRNLTQMIADDGYYRAAELPSMPRTPDLFYRTSVEAICSELAGYFVDRGSNPRYASGNATSRTAALEDMVTTIMGIPPADLRHGPAVQILGAHYAAALAAPIRASPTTALQSTFVLACSSPTSALIGL